MPQASCITITDPITAYVYNFCPVEASAGKTVLIYRSAAGSIYDAVIILTYSNASAQRNTHKSSISLSYPVNVKDADGNIISVETMRFVNGQYIIPANVSPNSRTDFANIVEALLADPKVRSYYESLDPMY